MLNTPIIEVVVGLIFVFSLMAILVTQINSIISAALNLRAKQLKKGLQELVTDKQTQARLLAHPIISMVPVALPPQVQLTDDIAEEIVSSEATKVTYIPPSTFIEAMIGILITESDRSLYRGLNAAVNALPTSDEKSELRELLQSLRADFSEDALRQIRAVIERVTDEPARERLLESMLEIEETVARLRFRGTELIPLLNGIRKIDEPRFKSALESILVTARSMEEAQEKLEAWFNDGMSRASSLFQKRLQIYSIIVAIVLTVLLNIDTIHLGRVLWENPELRASVAAAAREFDQESVTVEPSGTDLGAPVDEGENGNDEDTTFEDLAEEVGAARDTVQVLLELQLPIGWQYTRVTADMIETSENLGLSDPRSNPRNLWNLIPGNNPGWFSLLLQKILGITVTIIAASQGAPFWFDLLNRITRR